MVDTDDTRRTTGDSRRTTDDGRRTTPGVWHKLPTGELKNIPKSVVFEKKIFKVLHSICYVQIVFGYYFANNVGGATI